MKSLLPDKLYFKIGEVSQIVGVEPHVLRYWESEFSEIKPYRPPSGQRLYRRADLELLLEIKSLLYSQGFTIAGAKRALARGEKGQLELGFAEKSSREKELLIEIKKELGELLKLLDNYTVPERHKK